MHGSRCRCSLTGHGVSVHVVQDVPEAQDAGGGGRRAAPEQRRAEFVAGLARAKVRAGAGSHHEPDRPAAAAAGTHAAGERVHLVRAAAAASLDLASVALHAHLLLLLLLLAARKIQRKAGGRDTIIIRQKKGENEEK